jgi:hypothetical protein
MIGSCCLKRRWIQGCGACRGPIGRGFGGHGLSAGHSPNHFGWCGHGGQGRGHDTNQSDPVVCQVHGKKYHTAMECWHRLMKPTPKIKSPHMQR